ncbi:hypothetical protein LptCag_0509 [Leptospirillum ferriphilum]|uniref:MtN3 and saliva related transmembrane protein n=3 Tax=Leptospirillum TaxID=179 RepID=A0A094X2I0_9BACT|nr:hypothetical protein LptCag_0509 [Leptospirillum ferriphilum]
MDPHEDHPVCRPFEYKTPILSRFPPMTFFHGIDPANMIGFLAGALTTVSFLPQIVKVLKTRDTRSLSVSMYGLFTLGVFLWLVYGWIVHSPPVIFYNAMTFLLSAALLAAKIRWH